MPIRCTASHRQLLLDILAAQPLPNTFLLADIENFGFDAPFMKIWLEQDCPQPVIYLLFYDNLAVYSQNPQNASAAFVRSLLAQEGIACIMGMLPTMKALAQNLPGWQLNPKVLCGKTADAAAPANETDSPLVQQAAPADVDEIHAMLNSLPELAGLYASKDMIAARVAGADGVHLIIRQNGQIVAHGNTAASSSKATMMGGIATLPGWRRKGLARKVVAAMCRRIQATGKTPCSLCTDEYFDLFFAPMGFGKVCGWGMLTK